jgi:hypothetical protein
MTKQLSRLWQRLATRRSDRRATRAERTLRQNEAKALRLRHERFEDKGGGPMGGPSI